MNALRRAKRDEKNLEVLTTTLKYVLDTKNSKTNNNE